MQALPAIFTSVGGLGTALEVGGGILGLLTSFAASKQSEYIAENNADVAERNAENAVLKAQMDAKDQDMMAREELGQSLASFGASGVLSTQGSPMMQRKSLRELAAQDRGRIRQDGDYTAQGYKQQAADYRYEARAQKSGRVFSLIGGGIDVGTSLVSGANRVKREKILDKKALT